LFGFDVNPEITQFDIIQLQPLQQLKTRATVTYDLENQ
jgi:hypothetical protein